MTSSSKTGRMSGNRSKYLLFIVVIVLLSVTSCQSVKPYQRMYLEDREMAFGTKTIEGMDLKAQAYREGAAGTGKGKSSGGCGCR